MLSIPIYFLPFIPISRQKFNSLLTNLKDNSNVVDRIRKSDEKMGGGKKEGKERGGGGKDFLYLFILFFFIFIFFFLTIGSYIF